MATNYANWGQVPAKTKKQPGVNVGGSVGSIVQSGAQTVKKAGITTPVQKVVGSGSGASTGTPASAAPVAAPPASSQMGAVSGLSNLGAAPAVSNPVVPGGPAGTGASVPIGGGAVVAQSTGAGTGTPGTGGLGTDNSTGDPFTGFAGRYDPSGVGALYNNPQLLANDVLSGMGLGGNVALQNQLGDIAQIAPALAFLMSSKFNNGQGDESSINTMAGILKDQMTPGGTALDYRALLNDLMGGGDLVNSYTSLDANGNALSGADQSNAVKGLLSAALGNVNPFAQRAMMGMTGNALNQWQGQLTQASPGNPPAGTALDYLRQSGLLNRFGG
jgi:hypothetical protein